MKLTRYLLGICLVFSIIPACERVSNVFDKGTLKDVVECIKENKSDLISAKLKKQLRKACIKQNEIALRKGHTARAKNVSLSTNSGVLTVSLENEHKNEIISTVRFNFEVVDKSCERHPVGVKEISNLWIEPNEIYETTVEIDGFSLNPDAIDCNFNKLPSEIGGTCWRAGLRPSCSVSVTGDVRGVRIEILDSS
jgi:hypothetical protein